MIPTRLRLRHGQPLSAGPGLWYTTRMSDERTDDNLAEKAAAWGLTVEQFLRRRARKPAWVCYALGAAAWVLAQWCFWSAASLTSVVDASARQRAEYWACGAVAALVFALLAAAGLVQSVRLLRRRVPLGGLLTGIGSALLAGGASAVAWWVARAAGP